MFYRFKNTRQPTAGAMRYAFTSEALPENSPIGFGIAAMTSLHVLQPPQTMWNHTVVPAGLGGIVAGQIVMQPLWNNTILNG